MRLRHKGSPPLRQFVDRQALYEESKTPEPEKYRKLI